MGRYLSLRFVHLTTDWLTLQQPQLASQPFVYARSVRNRKIVTALNEAAAALGIQKQMVVADARVLAPTLKVIDDPEGQETMLLTRIGLWCIRYTPDVSLAPPDGLILDISGCTHLWKGEQPYLEDIVGKIRSRGFYVIGAIADTPGAAWAWSHYGKGKEILAEGEHRSALLPLPAPALRLDDPTLLKLKKMKLTTIGVILQQPRQSLLPRFGKDLVQRLAQALGQAKERLVPLVPPVEYQAWEAAPSPIRYAKGIEIALTRLLEKLCAKLQKEDKGLRQAVFTIYRVDNKTQSLTVGTTRPTYNIAHIYRLFETKIETLAPGEGIEAFLLQAPKVEKAGSPQEALWAAGGGVDSAGFAELLDRLANKDGIATIERYLPSEHYWPERSFLKAKSLKDLPGSPWPDDWLWPIHMFEKPAPITVTAPIPDYPPMHFVFEGKHHKVVKADGPRRVEHEWWIEDNLHRDYYAVEDTEGNRYCIFRAGHYGDRTPARWFIHGFFG